jgi:hypothetical protein
MLQEAFGDNAMNQSKTFVWYKRFKDGRSSVDDDERSGRPSTSTTPENVANVREAILADRRQTIHDICEIVGLSYGTVQRILLGSLNMRRTSTRFVPRLLTDDQKVLRVSVCNSNNKPETTPASSPISLPVMKHGCMVMTLTLSSSRRSGSRQIHRSRKKRVKFAAMSSPCWSFFFDIQGIDHKEFVPSGQTVNGKFYYKFLKRLREGIGANAQTSGRKTAGSSTMTSLPLTHYSLFDNSWLPKTLLWFPTPSIRLTSPPGTFSYSPRWT